MTVQLVIDIAQLSLVTFMKVAGPMLIASMVVGVTISLFQSMTQINEITLTFVPKILIVLLTAVFFLPWIITTISQFTHEMMFVIPTTLSM